LRRCMKDCRSFGEIAGHRALSRTKKYHGIAFKSNNLFRLELISCAESAAE
jgi:hypothetical protein